MQQNNEGRRRKPERKRVDTKTGVKTEEGNKEGTKERREGRNRKLSISMKEK